MLKKLAVWYFHLKLRLDRKELREIENWLWKDDTLLANRMLLAWAWHHGSRSDKIKLAEILRGRIQKTENALALARLQE